MASNNQQLGALEGGQEEHGGLDYDSLKLDPRKIPFVKRSQRLLDTYTTSDKG